MRTVSKHSCGVENLGPSGEVSKYAMQGIGAFGQPVHRQQLFGCNSDFSKKNHI